MTDIIHQFPSKATPQKEAMEFLDELQPDNMLVIATKGDITHMISSYSDRPLVNYLLDELKMGMILGVDEDYDE